MSTFLKGFEFGEQFIPIKVDGQPKFYQRLGFRKVEIISQAEVMTDLARLTSGERSWYDFLIII